MPVLGSVSGDALVGLVGVLIGAAISVGFNAWIEASRARREESHRQHDARNLRVAELRGRWDDIAGTIAQFVHYCAMSRVTVDAHPTQADSEEFSAERQEWTYYAFLKLSELRAEVERLRMDRNPEIVEAAGMIGGAADHLHRLAIGFESPDGSYNEWLNLLLLAQEILRGEIRIECGFPFEHDGDKCGNSGADGGEDQ